MIEDLSYSLTSSDQFSILWSFQFGSEGYISVSGDGSSIPSNQYEQVLFVSEDQLSPLRSVSVSKACSTSILNKDTTFDYIIDKENRHFEFNYTVSKSQWYYILQLNCNSTSYSLSMHLEAINPGGEYLSLSDVPFKFMYVATAGIWILATYYGYIIGLDIVILILSCMFFLH